MSKRFWLSGVASMALALSATTVAAAPVLFNTGVDSSGNVLAGSSTDNNWALGGGASGQPVVLSGNGGAFFVWTANDPTGGPGSAWIGLTNNTAQMTPPGGVTPSTADIGSYTFSQSFNVADPNLAVLSGTWFIDDAGTLSVNGHLVDTETADYNGVAFSVPNADFVTGLNTITMTMTTGDGLWDGVRIAFNDVEGITSATPLPAALPLFAGGLSALGLFGWRKKRKNTRALAAA